MGPEELVLGAMAAGGAGAGAATAGPATLAGILAGLTPAVPEVAMSSLPFLGGGAGIGAGALEGALGTAGALGGSTAAPGTLDAVLQSLAGPASTMTGAPGGLEATLQSLGATLPGQVGPGTSMGQNIDLIKLLKGIGNMKQGIDMMSQQPQAQQLSPGGGGSESRGSGGQQMPMLGQAEKQALLQYIMRKYGLGSNVTPVLRGAF